MEVYGFVRWENHLFSWAMAPPWRTVSHNQVGYLKIHGGSILKWPDLDDINDYFWGATRGVTN